MLDAGRLPEQTEGLTVFADHADPHRFYVAANRPGVASNPESQVSLLEFRTGSEGGGLLQFRTALTPTEEQLLVARNRLTQVGGTEPTLVRPDWRDGRVRIFGWLAEEELAPLTLATGPISLVGDPTALISARLDSAATALADASLRGDSLPTAVIFELETLGLAGPLGIEAEADLQAIHDRLKAAGALTTPYGSARLANTWEEFERDHLIRIRIVDESLDFEGRRAEALRRIGEELVSRMLSPAPPPERPTMLDDAPVAPIELSFRLIVGREELQATAHWSFLDRRAVPVRHYAAANLIDLLGGRPAAERIKTVDLEAGRTEIVVRAEPELSELCITSLEVELRSGETGDPIETVLLTPETVEQRLPITQSLADPVWHRVKARYDPECTSVETRESAWFKDEGNFVLVSARRIFPPRVLTVILGRAELDWIETVELLIEAPGEQPRKFLLDASCRSRECFFPAVTAGPLLLTAQWHGRAGEPSASEPTREVDEEILVLDSPFGESIHVLVVPLPLANVVSTAVELRVEQEEFSSSKVVSWELAERTPKEVSLRRMVAGPRAYAYRITSVRSNGTLEQQGWNHSENATLVVGSEEPVAVTRVEVVLLGGGPAGRGSLGVELILKSGQQSTTDLLEGNRDRSELFLVAPEGSPEPVLEAREFLNSGQAVETTWQSPGDLVVLPAPLPADH